MKGYSDFLSVGTGKSNLPFELLGRAVGCARVTAGQKRPHLCFFQDLMFLYRGDRDLRVAFQSHTWSQVSSRGEAKDSALLSSRDGYILEPTEWPKGSEASSGVWREDSGLLSRPCRKRRPSSHDDRGVLFVFSRCGASVGFLTRYDGQLREPLVCRQRSQFSMHVTWGRASLL